MISRDVRHTVQRGETTSHVLQHIDIFTTSSVRTTRRAGELRLTRSSPKTACSTIPTVASIGAATRSIASRARSELLILTFDISQLPSRRNWATAGGSNGYRGPLAMRQLTPGLILLLPETAGLPPSISFSTSYPNLGLCLVRASLLLIRSSFVERLASHSVGKRIIALRGPYLPLFRHGFAARPGFSTAAQGHAAGNR